MNICRWHNQLRGLIVEALIGTKHSKSFQAQTNLHHCEILASWTIVELCSPTYWPQNSWSLLSNNHILSPFVRPLTWLEDDKQMAWMWCFALCMNTHALLCVCKSQHTRRRNAARWKGRKTQGETAGGARSTAAEGVGGAKCQQINKGGKSGSARELSIAHWLTFGKKKSMKDVLLKKWKKVMER